MRTPAILASRSVFAVFKLEPLRTWCKQRTSATALRVQQSATRGTDWPKTGFTCAIDLVGLQFLDAVLDFATLAVIALSEQLRRLLLIRNHKACAFLGSFIFRAYHFGLDDDALLLLPGSGRIVGFSVDELCSV